jgi:tetratricopeptide (TPR) repeat protein
MRKTSVLSPAVFCLALCCGALGAAERSAYPPAARSRFEQGQELEKKGQYREAIQAFEDAIRLGMDDFPRVHLARARSSLRLQEYDEAIARYTKFIARFSLEESCRH